MNITGNTILITGATSGIGRALAVALHDRGNRVIITGRRQALLDEITAQRPGITALPLDINDPALLARVAEEVRTRFPDLNVLFANAGISQAEDVTASDWNTSVAESLIATNITGVLRFTAAFLPQLKARKDATLMVTSSNLAFIPSAAYPTYCATKAFLHSWLQSLRHQLRKVPVEVLELAPPYVQTELTGQAQTTDPRAMPLAAYVAEVMQLLEAHNHPAGEILVQYGRERRYAEREGRYEAAFAAMNPP